MKIPMPSPRGTNRERLHLVVLRDPPGRMALDAAPDWMQAEDPVNAQPDTTSVSDAATALLSFLRDALDADSYDRAEQLVFALAGELSGEPAGTDAPPPFRGQPEAGGGMAGDAKLREIAHNAARWAVGRTARAALERRFPGFDRVRFLG